MKTTFRIFVVLTILCAGAIFYFSSKPADESNDQSLSIGRIICSVVIPGFDNMTPQAQEEYVHSVNHFVRKTAHATEFCALGFLACAAVQAKHGEEGKNALLWALGAWVFAIIYACSDEIHQIFIPGRACQFRDVCIDSCGSLIGVCLSYFVFRIIWTQIKRKQA